MQMLSQIAFALSQPPCRNHLNAGAVPQTTMLRIFVANLYRFRFPKRLHMRRAKDFERTYARRQQAGDDVLLVFGCENDLPHPRLGLSVSRKVGNAVVRNRWKRLLREAFRLSQHDLPSGVDLIAIPRKGVVPSLESVRESLQRLARRVAQKLERSRP